MGRRYGEGFVARFGNHFLLKKERFEKLKSLLAKYAGRTLVLGRFNSFTRGFSPFLAGTAGVPLPKFILFDVLGGVAWALAFVSIGFFFGKSYEIGSKYLGDAVFIALLLGAVIVALYRMAYKRRRIFERRHLKVLILNVVSLYLFAKMWEDVLDREPITKLDLWVNGKAALLQQALPVPAMKAISVLAGPIPIGIASAILCGYLLFQRQKGRALLLFLSLSGGALLNRWSGDLVPRLRPSNALVGASGQGFPSIHAELPVLLCAVVTYLVYARTEKRGWRAVCVLACILLVATICGCRIFLAADWCSDVLAGLSLGLFWATLLILFFQVFSKLDPGPRNYTEGKGSFPGDVEKGKNSPH